MTEEEQLIPPALLSDKMEGWEKKVLTEYSQGASDDEIVALLKTTVNTFKLWYSKYPLFQKIISNGQVLAKAWWLRMGRENLNNKQFNYQGWFMQMKNLYGWSDKTTTQINTIEEIANMDKEQLDERINELAARRAKMVGM